MKRNAIKLFVVLLCVLTNNVFSQISITGLPYTEYYSFDVGDPSSIGTTTSVLLPTGFKVAKSTSVNTIPSYPLTGGDTLEYIGGEAMSPSAPGGIYNFGAGVPQTEIDRSIGFLASATTGLKTGILYAHLRNATGALLNVFSFSFDVDVFRNGMNPAGFKLVLYTSSDGTNWTPVPDGEFLFSPDFNNNGHVPAPASGRTISREIGFEKTVPNNSDIYLAWVYTVASGTNTNNAQALSVDNVFIIAEYNPALPILLHSFSAKRDQEKVKVNWTTATEINNHKFLVEKSIDGQQFEFVAEVSGVGNSKELNAYEVIDPNPFKGTSYYRLTQIDYNGETQQFTPVAVDADVQKMSVETLSDKLLGIYSPSKGEASILIHDVSGRTIFSEKIMLEEGYQHYQLSSSLFLSGLYTIQVLNDKELVTKKVLF